MNVVRPTLRCACGETNLEEVLRYNTPPIGETKFDIGSTAYRRAYDRCRVCSHMFGRHQLDIVRLYESDYVDGTYGSAEGMRRKFEQILSLPPAKSDNSGRVARVLAYRRLQNPSVAYSRLLDVGAGLGVFPAAMKAAGWHVFAVEPDVRTVQHLNDVVGITAWAQNLFDLPVEKTERFDVVSLNKVLEHVEDPVALLARAAEFVATHGFLYIELPDVAAIREGADREEFYIEHHHVFSPESFAMLVTRAGLVLQRIERLREPSGKFTLVGFCAL